MVKLTRLAGLLNVEYEGERDTYAYLAEQLHGSVTINWGGEDKEEKDGRKESLNENPQFNWGSVIFDSL